ncbi:error-prone DNA polymerase [Novispirillum sp. DQ9]|uniref:error-prone DNA polymerase n=1 Tax=Novispirillum sp. DQ9 TaxID=3398612 RepID=UPI003C7B1E25
MTEETRALPAPYADLDVTTNYSFLHGASHPDELVLTAAALGHSAIAVTDRNTLAGVVRAHAAARRAGLRLVVGCRLELLDAPSLLVYPTDRAAYGRLCRLLTLGRRRAPKGECHLERADLAAHAEGLVAIALPPEEGDIRADLPALREMFGGRLHLAARCRLDGRDARRLAALAEVAEACGTPLVATNGVLMHTPARRPLLDVLTCIREKLTIDTAGWRLSANAEAHLKSPAAMARLFRDHPEALSRIGGIVAACAFSLDELRYEYPDEPVPAGSTPQEELERLTWDGARAFWPGGIPETVERQIRHEFAVIGQLGYAPYFLTVHDIVRFARSKDILCQGRGSAANSAVCFCLGITSVNPCEQDLLFERFISAARNEPPDIDVDFEHERREEVIQYIYARYGRHRAGLAATVITYRTRSALRDVGKAMGLSEDVITALTATVWGSSSEPLGDGRVREAGLDPADPRLRLTLDLVAELKGFPRHLSQHVGGFVLTRGPLDEVVPIENAAMADRTVIQWDKDDLDALGILKIDVLALGMLTCIRKAFALIARHGGPRLTLATVPQEDKATYDMLCEADSIGVFQVESRAQMTMLPRLRPRTFYDLVIEVAIVRPGPIQGDMVHPYLRRRQGKEAVSYPSDALRGVLGKTLGVPLFQEQAMKIAIVAAGFTPAEADDLRRAMATFKRGGAVHAFRDKFLSGMRRNGYGVQFAESCFRQLEGFGSYGFPESHAAAFAQLAYVSAWLKRHHPAAFACALLNAQPMGFYAPAQIVQDAQRHGVPVRPVDINASDWDNTLEAQVWPGGRRSLALRLGFRQISGLSGTGAGAAVQALLAARALPYRDPADVWSRAGVPVSVLEKLAGADVFASLGLSRRDALWAVKRLGAAPLPLFAAAEAREDEGEPATRLPDLLPGEQVVEDYSTLRLTLRQHPMALLRPTLARERLTPAARLAELRDGARVTVGGLAICRQRPGTASGVIFITLEDETGTANLVIWPKVFEAQRREVLRGRLLAAEGRVQKEGLVLHVVADRLRDLTDALRRLTPDAQFLYPVSTHADRIKHNPAA